MTSKPEVFRIKKENLLQEKFGSGVRALFSR